MAQTGEKQLLSEHIQAKIPTGDTYVVHRLGVVPNKVILVGVDNNPADIKIGSATDSYVKITNNGSETTIHLEVMAFHSISADVGKTVSDYTGATPTHTYYDGAGNFALSIKESMVHIKTVDITVAQNSNSGSSSADDSLIGAKVIGIVPIGNQDQFVKNVTVGADGSVTVTLAANATADNEFRVALLCAL